LKQKHQKHSRRGKHQHQRDHHQQVHVHLTLTCKPHSKFLTSWYGACRCKESGNVRGRGRGRRSRGRGKQFTRYPCSSMCNCTVNCNCNTSHNTTDTRVAGGAVSVTGTTFTPPLSLPSALVKTLRVPKKDRISAATFMGVYVKDLNLAQRHQDSTGSGKARKAEEGGRVISGERVQRDLDGKGGLYTSCPKFAGIEGGWDVNLVNQIEAVMRIAEDEVTVHCQGLLKAVKIPAHVKYVHMHRSLLLSGEVNLSWQHPPCIVSCNCNCNTWFGTGMSLMQGQSPVAIGAEIGVEYWAPAQPHHVEGKHSNLPRFQYGVTLTKDAIATQVFQGQEAQWEHVPCLTGRSMAQIQASLGCIQDDVRIVVLAGFNLLWPRQYREANMHPLAQAQGSDDGKVPMFTLFVYPVEYAHCAPKHFGLRVLGFGMYVPNVVEEAEWTSGDQWFSWSMHLLLKSSPHELARCLREEVDHAPWLHMELLDPPKIEIVQEFCEAHPDCLSDETFHWFLHLYCSPFGRFSTSKPKKGVANAEHGEGFLPANGEGELPLCVCAACNGSLNLCCL
jgi:hypothetical protein